MKKIKIPKEVLEEIKKLTDDSNIGAQSLEFWRGVRFMFDKIDKLKQKLGIK